MANEEKRLTGVRLNKQLIKTLKILSFQQDTTYSSVVEMAVCEYIAKEFKKKREQSVNTAQAIDFAGII